MPSMGHFCVDFSILSIMNCAHTHVQTQHVAKEAGNSFEKMKLHTLCLPDQLCWLVLCFLHSKKLVSLCLVSKHHEHTAFELTLRLSFPPHLNTFNLAKLLKKLCQTIKCDVLRKWFLLKTTTTKKCIERYDSQKQKSILLVLQCIWYARIWAFTTCAIFAFLYLLTHLYICITSLCNAQNSWNDTPVTYDIICSGQKVILSFFCVVGEWLGCRASDLGWVLTYLHETNF